MKIGLMYGMTLRPGEDSLEGWTDYAKMADDKGFSTLWLPNIMGWDAMTALCVADRISPI